MKGDESKFYNPDKKKCVIFPDVGSFEVYFRGRRLFSKKKTNLWPDFREISKRITTIVEEPEKSLPTLPAFYRTSMEESEDEVMQESGTDRDTITFTKNNFDSEDKRSTFYHQRPKEKNNFTLTDHFKIYKMKKQR